MRLEWLHLENCRRFERAEAAFAPGVNLILGDNGAGKTTVLEAAHLLSHGRSFRRGSRAVLQRYGGGPLRIVAGIATGVAAGVTRVGFERQDAGWQARVDGQPAATLNEVLMRCAICSFEPGSHELVSGSGEGRRSFLDWGVFHVEPEFLEQWRRYTRTLRQANALLRRGAKTAELEPWYQIMESTAVRLTHHRETWIHDWRQRFRYEASRLLPELGDAAVDFNPGWDPATPLARQLVDRLGHDRRRAHVSRGPHRSDWTPTFERLPQREMLSRGQEKLVALAAMLAQASLHAELKNEWPILLFDDLPSELDTVHQQRVFHRLAELPAQMLLTATGISPELQALGPERVFHVEQGKLGTAEKPVGPEPN